MTHPNLEQVLETFVGESTELLVEMEQRLLALEGQPHDEEILNALFRTVHTIKGGAGIFGFDPVVDFTHIVENVLDRLRNGQVILDPALTELLLRCKDHIGALVDTVMKGDAVTAELTRAGGSLKGRLNTYLGKTNLSLSGGPSSLSGETAIPSRTTALPVEASADVRRVANQAWHR
ncbi:hypothetical protein CCP3SC15_720010 [Gammaproteobacteria bacterium]